MSAPTRTYRIAAIPADGVGKEVVAAGRTVLDALAAASNGAFAFDWDEFPWGCEYYAQTGRMMAEDGLETLKDFDAIYFGAVGWPTRPRPHQPVGPAPEHLARTSTSGPTSARCTSCPACLARCARPTTPTSTGSSSARTARASTPASAAATCPAAARATRSPCRPRCSPRRAASGSSASPSTWPAPARCKKVSSVTKSNAQQYGMVLWDETFDRVAAGLPGRRHRERAGRRDVREVRPPARGPVGRRRLQPQRRHPLRPRLRPGRQPRPGRQRQPQPRAPLPEHVRAGPRLRARHRRPGHRQPDRHDRQRRADAGALRPARRGRPPAEGRRRRHRLGRAHPRRRRHRRPPTRSSPRSSTTWASRPPDGPAGPSNRSSVGCRLPQPPPASTATLRDARSRALPAVPPTLGRPHPTWPA